MTPGRRSSIIIGVLLRFKPSLLSTPALSSTLLQPLVSWLCFHHRLKTADFSFTTVPRLLFSCSNSISAVHSCAKESKLNYWENRDSNDCPTTSTVMIRDRMHDNLVIIEPPSKILQTLPCSASGLWRE